MSKKNKKKPNKKKNNAWESFNRKGFFIYFHHFSLLENTTFRLMPKILNKTTYKYFKTLTEQASVHVA